MHICGIQKNSIDNLICKTETEAENKGMDTKEECRMNWEFGIDIYTLLILCIEQITKENLVDSTGNSTQCSVVTKMGRKSKKEGIYIYTHTHTYGGHTNPL